MIDIFIVKDKRTIILFIFFVCLVMCAKCLYAEESSIDHYIGPSVGKRYIYENSNGQKMEMVGIKYLGGNVIEVDEIRSFDYKKLPPGVPKENKLTYRLRISDNKIIQEFRGKSQIILEYNGKTDDSKWKIEGVKLVPGKKVVSIPTQCEIIEKRQKYIFEKERMILTKKCITKEAEVSLVTVEKYAEGIGLIERSSFVIDGKGKEDKNNIYYLNKIVDERKSKKK